ncbi:hypothetical protein LJC35_04900 [Parabacteroides sp. OttesenSCG-928-N08]|nr:hypothetical protein [Parabacteroides sp. OttesenSCG-928-N08]
MKRTFQSIALTLTAIALMTACDNNNDAPQTDEGKTCISVGNLTVAGEAIETRSVSDWSAEYAPFYPDELLRVAVSHKDEPNPDRTTTFRFTDIATWTPAPQTGERELIKEELIDGDTFAAAKGSEETVTTQNSLATYCAADYITGELELSADGRQLVNADGTTLEHQHVDVVIKITPTTDSKHWEGIDFIEQMKATEIDFLTTETQDSKPVTITPLLATITPQMATYRAVIPLVKLPASDSRIIRIASPTGAPLYATYSATGVDKGTRLTITISYDNKRLLTTGTTVESWTQAPDYDAEHNAYDMVIRTADDLKAFRDLVNGGLYTLTAIQVADITLTGKWTPIGSGTGAYQGTYNGGGYNITGLATSDAKANNQGLFGYCDNATLTDIHLKEVRVIGNKYIGALVGRANKTHITYCDATGGSVDGPEVVGGLLGYNQHSVAAYCHAQIRVSAQQIVGGLTGYNYGSSSTPSYTLACYATGNVISTGDGTSGDANAATAGGLVGTNHDYSTIAFCYAIGAVESIGDKNANTGGITGWNSGNKGGIYSCYSTGTVTRNSNATNSYYGNLIGKKVDTGTGTVSYCHAADPLTGTGSVDDSCSTTDGAAGSTVRGYPNEIGPLVIRTGIHTTITRTFSADLWERNAATPGLIW